MQHCLDSIGKASEGLTVETIVVDNNSADGSVDMVREKFPNVVCIANDANIGFGKANNQGVRRGSGEFFLILNPDTILQEDSLRKLLEFGRAHPDAGAIGCKIINPDGSFAPESRRAFPTPRVAFYRIAGLSKIFPKSARFGRYNMTYLPEDEETEVDALSGSCMLVRSAAIDSLDDDGRLFDEDFFMYGEDLDACYRLQQKNWKIWYTPRTQIIHFKGESTKKGELRYVRLFYGAMLLFAEKHFDNRYGTGMKLALRVSIFGRAVLSAFSTIARKYAPALLDFVLVFLVMAAIATLRSIFAGTQTSLLQYSVVAPVFALGTVAGISLIRGYRRRGLHRVTPTLAGILLGALLVSAISFFYKDIAFSRLSIALAVPAGWLALLIPRLFRYRRQKPSRTIFAGTDVEARTLGKSIDSPFEQPLLLVGYVFPGEEQSSARSSEALGPLRQLRDIVRLNDADTIIFSSDSLSNENIFAAMRSVADLEVDLKIQTPRTKAGGAAAQDEYVRPTFVSAEDAVGRVRSRSSKRAFDTILSIILLLIYPIRFCIALVRGPKAKRALRDQTREIAQVVRGRSALIGYRPDSSSRPPDDWGLEPGVFSLADTLESSRLGGASDEAVQTALWHYSTHQSTLFDLYILWRILSRPARF